MNSNDKKYASRRKLNKFVVVAIVIAALLCACAVAFFVYTSDYYHATPKAQEIAASAESSSNQGQAAESSSDQGQTAESSTNQEQSAESSSDQGQVAEPSPSRGHNYLTFGDPDASVGIIFYPGAKVEYRAYAPLMSELAQRGYFVVIPEVPFNLAFFGIDTADDIRADYPHVGTWWIGGHSLGGSMAAEYAAQHANELGGLILLAAYPASDLSDSNLGCVVVYGSNDQVLNREKLDDSTNLMPPNTETQVIEGGNHAYFGDYGEQSGDGSANITPEGQRKQTVDAIDAYILEHEA